MIAEPKYKHGQQEQVTVKNHNRSTALEPFLRCIGYLSFTKDRIKHDLLQTQVLVLQLNFLNY